MTLFDKDFIIKFLGFVLLCNFAIKNIIEPVQLAYVTTQKQLRLQELNKKYVNQEILKILGTVRYKQPEDYLD